MEQINAHQPTTSQETETTAKTAATKSASHHDNRQYELQIFHALRRIIRAVDLHSRKLKARYKLTAPQLICLMEIVEDGPLTATAIAIRVHVTTSTVVGILDRLEEKDLIKRERDKDDRRLVNITATDKGREVIREAPSPLQDGLANALEKLSSQEKESVAQSLKRVVRMMEEQQEADTSEASAN